jgi:hypothetical protein
MIDNAEDEGTCPVCGVTGKFYVETRAGLRVYSSCGHKLQYVIVEDKLNLCESIKIHNPKIILREALEQKKWFEGIVLSATFFEHYGLEKLKSF